MRVRITEEQFKTATKRFAEVEKLDMLRQELTSIEKIETKDKVRKWVQSAFQLGKLLGGCSSKDAWCREEIFKEYDGIMNRIDDLEIV